MINIVDVLLPQRDNGENSSVSDRSSQVRVCYGLVHLKQVSPDGIPAKVMVYSIISHIHNLHYHSFRNCELRCGYLQQASPSAL